MPKSSYSGKGTQIGTGKKVNIRTGTDVYVDETGGYGVPLVYQAKRRYPQALPKKASSFFTKKGK